MPVLSKICPVKCWDFANRRRFPVRFPRFTVIFHDFQRNNPQGGDYLIPFYADTDISPLVSYMFLLLPLQVLNIRFDKDTGGETIEIT